MGDSREDSRKNHKRNEGVAKSGRARNHQGQNQGSGQDIDQADDSPLGVGDAVVVQMNRHL